MLRSISNNIVGYNKISNPSTSSSLWLMPLNYCAMGTKALIKTNKAAAKRFRVRGSGSIKR